VRACALGASGGVGLRGEESKRVFEEEEEEEEEV
jgi:hypothetical protein